MFVIFCSKYVGSATCPLFTNTSSTYYTRRHTFMQMHLHTLSINIFNCIYICMCVCLCIQFRQRSHPLYDTHRHLHLPMYTYTHIQAYTVICIYTYVCMYAYHTRVCKYLFNVYKYSTLASSKSTCYFCYFYKNNKLQ